MNKTYKIIDSSGKTVVLSGGTELSGFETEEKAKDCMRAYHHQAMKDKKEVHNWQTFVVVEDEIKTCKICGTMISAYGNRKYCPECSYQLRLKRHKEYYDKPKTKEKLKKDYQLKKLRKVIK